MHLRLRTILALLVLATTVPLGLFAGWTVRQSWRHQTAIVDQRNVEQTRAVVFAVDQEVRRIVASLEVLTTIESLDAPDFSQFSRVAERTVRIHDGWQAVRLVDPSGRVLASTDAPRGTPAALVTADWVETVLRTGAVGVSRLQKDNSGRYTVSIGVPVSREGRVKYVLGARVSTTVFSVVLQQQQPPPDGVITLLDRTPVIIARTMHEDRLVGSPPTPDFVERVQQGIHGAWRTTILEGISVYGASSTSSFTGWTVGLGFPASVVEGPIRASLAGLIAAGFSTLIVGLSAALLLGRGVVRGQKRAAAAAGALARGRPVPVFTSPITELAELAGALREAASILELRLQERDEAQWELDRNRAVLLDREQAARRDAEALSRAKDEFVATVSHELRTPLNAIFGWVALLKSGALDEERRAHALDVIDRNARSQAQLIEDLLDMSRVIRSDVRLSMRPLDVAPALEATVDTLRPTAAARRIEIAVRANAGGIVAADPSRLQQILWNLLANALKFTPPGGRIEASVEAVANEVLVRISDTGEGIAPAFLPYVFDRFRQETADVSRTHSGLGIGLSLVRHLVELHGGSVSADSAGKGRGSTFTVRLPRLGARAPQIEVRAPAPTPPRDTGGRSLDGLHILVVDDDMDGRDLVATALQQSGARVTTAPAGDEAIGSVRAGSVDVIVVDVAMPNGSGYDLARTVRAQAQTASTPLVAITASNRPEDRERAVAEGFDAFLGKPFDPAALVSIIGGCAGR